MASSPDVRVRQLDWTAIKNALRLYDVQLDYMYTPSASSCLHESGGQKLHTLRKQGDIRDANITASIGTDRIVAAIVELGSSPDEFFKRRRYRR